MLAYLTFKKRTFGIQKNMGTVWNGNALMHTFINNKAGLGVIKVQIDANKKFG